MKEQPSFNASLKQDGDAKRSLAYLAVVLVEFRGGCQAEALRAFRAVFFNKCLTRPEIDGYAWESKVFEARQHGSIIASGQEASGNVRCSGLRPT